MGRLAANGPTCGCLRATKRVLKRNRWLSSLAFFLLGAVCGWLLVRDVYVAERRWLPANESDAPEFVKPALQPSKPIRILCLVMTMGKNFHKAKAVNETWGQRCDKLLFGSSVRLRNLPTLLIKVADDESRSHLWLKTQLGLARVAATYLNDYDWFMKADDDTYFVMENLKRYIEVGNFTREDPVCLGQRFNVSYGGRVDYHSGGGGYVFTRESLRRFVETSNELAKTDMYSSLDVEDVHTGLIWKHAGVRVVDTAEADGRFRFSPISLENFFEPLNVPPWLYTYAAPFPANDPVSDKLISMHYATPQAMRQMEYFLYKFRLMRPFSQYLNRPNGSRTTLDPPMQ